MSYYYQRLIGALLGFFFVGPLVTGLGGAALGGSVGPGEVLLGAVLGAVAGAYTAGRIARKKDTKQRA